MLLIAANQMQVIELEQRQRRGLQNMTANKNHHAPTSGQSEACYRLSAFRGGVGWLVPSEWGYTVLLYKVSSFECVKMLFFVKMYNQTGSPVGF